MKKLDILFSDNSKLQINDIADLLGVSKSDVARAALSIGLQKIKAIGSMDIEDAQSLTLMEALKAK